MRSVTACAGIILLFGGCAAQKREQYYMVVERAEGTAAIFKVTAKLEGVGTKYKLNEGYVPVNVIDALSGKVGEPPDLFSPVSQSQRQAQLNDELEDKRSQAILDLARNSEELKSMQPADVDKAIDGIDSAVRLFGALKAAAAMSANEQISIGQTGSTDIYSYRKLVFYASAQVIRLQEFEQELNELEKSTSDLAKAIVQAKQAKAEAVEAKAQQRGNLRQAILGQVQALFAKSPSERTHQDFLNIFAAAGLGGAS